MKLPDFLACRILIVGDVMLDRYWFGEVSRISPEAPVPIVSIQKTEHRLGGAANVALNIRSLGGQAHLLSVIGKDPAGEQLRHLLQESQISSTLFEDNIDTTIKLRVIGRQQQLIRIDFENTPSHELLLQSLDSFESLMPDFDVVAFSDYGKGGLTHISTMIEIARKHGKKIVVDPKGEDYARYRGATLLTPNRMELKAVIGSWANEDDLTQKAYALREALDLEALLVTRSEEGMTLFLEDAVIYQSAHAREVYDVSGAGDTVMGTICLMLAVNRNNDLFSWESALEVANCAAGIVVGKLGTATVTPDELAAELSIVESNS